MNGTGSKRKPLFRRACRWLCAIMLLLLLLPHLYSPAEKTLEGVGCRSGLLPVPADGVELLIDTTGYDAERGERVMDQHLFNHMLGAIHSARRVIMLDFFLWNAWQGRVPEEYRKLSGELADALIRRRQEAPDLDILVVTDPINRMYGTDTPEPFARMRAAGIVVVFTELDALRDSNRIYSPYARFYGKLLDSIPFVRAWLDRPRWPNLLCSSGPALSSRQMARLLFFKANHRKVLICDTGEDAVRLRLIVGSLNPADASSAHDNIGLQIDGALAATALTNELGVLSWSTGRDRANLTAMSSRMRRLADEIPAAGNPAPDGIFGEWLTEDAIRARLITILTQAGAGDEIRIGMFYLSDRGVVQAICRAVDAGASLRLLLDPNKDAFGRTKNGIPNRPVAAEILRRVRRTKDADCEIRWADTHGEQYHAKAMAVSNPEKNKWQFICGSANWTRRNLARFNLEADLYIENDRLLNERFAQYFDRVWSNEGGIHWSADYEQYADGDVSATGKNILYRFQEATGAGTF